MTRFESELNGSLGSYWKKSAEKELESLKVELEAGKITIDEYGVARNSIGRVVMNDVLEKLTYITDQVDCYATKAAREVQITAELAEYRKNQRPATEEEINEMRAAFGAGTKVIDVISGREILL